jgi:UDP-N-acetylglucosamine 2-epimerase
MPAALPKAQEIGKASYVRVLIVGNSANPGAAEDELTAAGIEVERRPDDSDLARGPDEIGAIARELREFERLLGENGPDAVLVASDSSASLAAVLVATKLGTPVAGIESAAAAGVNARLIAQLADAQLAAEPAAVSNWLRETYTERP